MFGDNGGVGVIDELLQHVRAEIGVEGLQTQLHLQIEAVEFAAQFGDVVSVAVMRFEMDRRNALLGANFLDQVDRLVVKLEHRAAVDDLDFAELARDVRKNLCIQGEVRVVVGTFIVVVVTESAGGEYAASPAEQNDLAGAFVVYLAVSVHKKVKRPQGTPPAVRALR